MPGLVHGDLFAKHGLNVVDRITRGTVLCLQMVAQVCMLPIFFLLLEMSQAVVLYLLCSAGATRLGFLLARRKASAITPDEVTSKPPAQLDENLLRDYVSQSESVRASRTAASGNAGESTEVGAAEWHMGAGNARQADCEMNDAIVHRFRADPGPPPPLSSAPPPVSLIAADKIVDQDKRAALSRRVHRRCSALAA